MEELAEYRRARLRDLQTRAEQLEGLRFVMYEQGVWTGYLNALDEHSPHCVQTVADVDCWHNAALGYITGFQHGYFAERSS